MNEKLVSYISVFAVMCLVTYVIISHMLPAYNLASQVFFILMGGLGLTVLLRLIEWANQQKKEAGIVIVLLFNVFVFLFMVIGATLPIAFLLTTMCTTVASGVVLVCFE